MAPIQRLKKTWELVDPSLQESLAYYGQLLASKDNFRMYHAHIGELSPPFLPHLTETLDALARIEDGSPETVKNLINFQKRREMYTVLHKIQDLQRWKFDYLAVNPIYSFLYCLPSLKEDEIDEISKLHEGKNAK